MAGSIGEGSSGRIHPIYSEHKNTRCRLAYRGGAPRMHPSVYRRSSVIGGGVYKQRVNSMRGPALRVLGYARVSTEEQARGGFSLEAQEAKIRGYCELYELDLVRIERD